MSIFQKKKSSFWVSPKCAGVLKRRLFLGIPNCQKFSQAVSVIWAPRPSHDFRLGLLAVSKIFVRIFLNLWSSHIFHAPTLRRDWFPTLAKSSPLECFASPGLTLPNSVSTSENSGLSGMDLCIWASRSSKHPETLRWFHTRHQVILKSYQASLSSRNPKLAPWESLLAVHVFFLPHLLGLFLWKFYEWKLETPSAWPWHQQGMDPLKRDVDKRP